MSKLPQPGKVKARLQPTLTPEQAADVYREFLVHLCKRLDTLQPDELIICHDPADARTPLRQLLEPVCSASYIPQIDGDPGQRIAHAAELIGVHHNRMLFVGVDSPDVPDDHLLKAADLTGRVPVSIGPTDDGGFWSLGLINTVDARALLSNINWSARGHGRQTISHAIALGYATAETDPWDDIDFPGDLQRLLNRLALSREQADFDLLMRLRACLPPGVLK